jgi:hypothetical protein
MLWQNSSDALSVDHGWNGIKVLTVSYAAIGLEAVGCVL